MGFTPGDDDSAQAVGNEKDTRRSRQREQETRAHHIWYERTGPDVIVRTQLGATRTCFEAEDAFDVSCDDVAHSLNKRRRWEKTENAERTLFQQNSSGKSSFVDAVLPAFLDRCSIGQSDVEIGSITRNTGGIRKYVEVEAGEIESRKSKSKAKSDLASLKRNDEDQTRRDGNVSVEGEHVRYTAFEKTKRDAKVVERSWRYAQNRHSQKPGRRRQYSMENLTDWIGEQQEELEERLDARFEKQHDSEEFEEELDSEEPVMPHHKEKPIEVIKEHSNRHGSHQIFRRLACDVWKRQKRRRESQKKGGWENDMI
ncbi:hypothetical protein PENTCL1PPCAC_16045 [Pristionchus entomophagus]|uniref:Uncharacterized protein n=1 Tax=Pristionchus entomophagus TaxID=358040 RepID=A0AAV5THT3_9BILA|nr:hypothetical protein PENTCL1PPCAC_16045 [Pristionchus entomophagus]